MNLILRHTEVSHIDHQIVVKYVLTVYLCTHHGHGVVPRQLRPNIYCKPRNW